MKQPELGKKIYESRKAKGLTQEQLVEMCNLNVRTIQRIEAGDVTPRNHTIKALFEALEIVWEEEVIKESKGFEGTIVDEKTLSEKITPTVTWLYIALFAGAINFILPFFENTLDVNPIKVDEINPSTFWWLKITSLILSTLFMGGLIKMTHIFPNRILRGTLWAMLVMNMFFISFELALGVKLNLMLVGFYLVRTIVFGSFFILVGLGFFSYKNLWSNYTQIIGVLGISSGVLLMSVLGAYFVTVPLFLFKAGQLGFLYWGINKIGKTSSPDSIFTAELQS